MKTCAECVLCLLNRDLAAVPASVGAREKSAYQREVLRMIADSDPALCAAQLGARMDAIYRAHFGERKQKDFDTLKRTYNERLLALEPRLQAAVDAAADPLAMALKLARAGNYIDFGAKHVVDDALLDKLLLGAEHETLDAGEYGHFRNDLARAGRVLYVTDNAGEIVLDKLLVKLLMARYPQAGLTLMVRGAPTLNDATVEDAEAVGLTGLVSVIGNGSDLPGTIWDEISQEARRSLSEADVIVSKGQANFESLSGCGLNVYYLLLCKCDYFVRRFRVPRLTGLFVNERRMPPMDE
ncbi:MAG: DUF89 family protein [Clostridiales bacterium]|nr:DUF89 family protein [Clostridiales bacterium]